MPRKRPEPNSAAHPAGWSPRDILIPYLLLAVSIQRAHGYMIEEYLRGRGFGGIDMSTMYRTLRQLEKDGLLNSEWESASAGPARRVYSLTDLGRVWLDNWASTLEAYRGLIDYFFDLYPGRLSHRDSSRNTATSGGAEGEREESDLDE